MAFPRCETPSEGISVKQYSVGHPVNKPLKYLSVLAAFCLLKSFESPCRRNCQKAFPVHLCLPRLYPSTITKCQNTQNPSDHHFLVPVFRCRFQLFVSSQSAPAVPDCKLLVHVTPHSRTIPFLLFSHDSSQKHFHREAFPFSR